MIMNKKIKIGADELILWMRKNNYGVNISNERLGFLICRIIDGGDGGVSVINGKKEFDDVPVLWPIGDDKKINSLRLPKTSAQYEIELSMLPKLYEELMNL